MKTLFLTAVLLIMSVGIKAQYGQAPCMGGQVVRLNLTGGTLISGTGNSAGSVYRYANANAGNPGVTQLIDVIYTVNNLTMPVINAINSYSFRYDETTASIAATGTTPSGFDANLQPSFVPANSGFSNQSTGTYVMKATLNVSFVLAGTNTPVSIPVIMQVIDNDGSTLTSGGSTLALGENVTFITPPSSIVIASPTAETISGNTVKGSFGVNQAGIGSAANYIGYAYYAGASSIDFNYSDSIVITGGTINATFSNRYHSFVIGCDFAAPGVNFTPINLSGTVFNDMNGLTDNTVNGNGTGLPGGTQLYVNLLDANNKVVATVPVSSNGIYTFQAIGINTSYSVQVSTIQGIPGNTAPATILSAGWVATGESATGTGIGSDGIPNQITSVPVATSTISNINFGIEQLPNTNNHSTNIFQPAINQFITLNGGANPPVLSGIDPEDCSSGCNLSGRSVTIDAVPSNSELYYNGILVTTGQQINNFDPSLLQVKITAATLGSASTSFQYSYVDAAGKKDPSPANYTLTWLQPLPVTGLVVTAKLNGTISYVDWKTESEYNSNYFVVERSTDNQNYSEAGFVAAAGNSSTRRNYLFTEDISSFLQHTVIYYRIRQVDTDTRAKYSNIAVIRNSKTAGVEAWPNPFKGNVSISIYSAVSAEVKVTLTNLAGQVLRIQNQQVMKGNTQIVLNNLEGLSSGVYLLKIQDSMGNISLIEKMIKE